MRREYPSDTLQRGCYFYQLLRVEFGHKLPRVLLIPRIDGGKNRLALCRQRYQLGTFVGGVIVVRDQTLPRQYIRDALHTLAGMPHVTGHLRDRLRLITGTAQHLPAGTTLAERARHALSRTHQQAVHGEDAQGELTQGIIGYTC